MSKGGSSSSSQSSQTTETTDNRIVADGGSLVLSNSSGNTLTLSDYGAIAGAGEAVSMALSTVDNTVDRALEFAKSGNELNQQSFLEVLGLTKSATQIVADSMKTGVAQVASAYETAREISSGSRLMVIGGLVLVGVVVMDRRARQ